MEYIINYEVQFLWQSLYHCNLNCSYCSNNFIRKDFNTIQPLDTERLIRSLDNSGKRCKITFTGGEPFLIPNFNEACRAITYNHLIYVISNFTTGKMKEFADTINPKKSGFLCSLHIRELENKNLLERFLSNYHYCLDKGFAIAVEEVAYPGLLEDLEKYKNFFADKGIPFKFVPYYGFYNEGKYPEDYTQEEIHAFDLQKNDLDRYNRNAGYCNAGYNNFVIIPGGDVYNCFRQMQPCGNIYESVPNPKKMQKCRHTYCECCASKIDKPLFNKALTQMKYRKGLLFVR